jgi:uncharacterized protein
VSSRPLVILFAKRPLPGAVKTRLCPPLSPEEAAGLYEAFLFDLFDRFARHRAPYTLAVAVDPPAERPWFEEHAPRDATFFDQRGSTLSERMEHAFADAFDAGYGPVAIVGTDLPTLPLAEVDRLLGPLDGDVRSADLTMGLDRGGGYWGLGLAAPQPQLFRALATSTGSVALETLKRARASGLSLRHAGVVGDIDTPGDLAALASSVREGNLDEAIPRTQALMERLGFL